MNSDNVFNWRQLSPLEAVKRIQMYIRNRRMDEDLYTLWQFLSRFSCPVVYLDRMYTATFRCEDDISRLRKMLFDIMEIQLERKMTVVQLTQKDVARRNLAGYRFRKGRRNRLRSQKEATGTGRVAIA